MTGNRSGWTTAGRVEREWLELVADLMVRPLGALPVERLALQLARTFDSAACAFSAALPGGELAGEIFPLTESLGGHRAAVVEWGARHAPRFHPVLVHYRGTGVVAPMQVADVSEVHVDGRLRSAWYCMAGEWGCADQFALPLPGDPGGTRAFVLGRDRPYSPAELEIGYRLCRLLVGLDRQVQALTGRGPEPAAADDARMTPRELAVLALLADGLTAAAIARRLDIRERTVHKHLEHVYAKLGVTDRLSAVVRAQHAGLLPAVAPGSIDAESADLVPARV